MKISLYRLPLALTGLAVSLVYTVASTLPAPSLANSSENMNLYTIQGTTGSHLIEIPDGHTIMVNQIDANGNLHTSIVSAPESKEMRLAKAKYMAAQDTRELKIIVDPSESNAFLWGAYAMHGELMTWKGIRDDDDNIIFTLPDGDYVIEMAWNDNAIIFVPDVKIQGEDIELHVSHDMATITVTPEVYLNNGEKAIMPQTYPPSGSDSFNVVDSYGLINISYNGYGCYGTTFMSYTGGEDWLKKATIKSNFLPEEGCHYSWIIQTLGTDEKSYFSTYIETTGNENVDTIIASNNPEDYRLTTADFQHTPIYYDKNLPSDGCSFMYKVYVNLETSGGIGMNSEIPLNVYATMLPYDKDKAFSVLRYGDVDYVNQYGGVSGINCPIMGIKDGEIFYFATQDENDYSLPDKPTYSSFCYNPYFSYPANGNEVFGSTSAICVTSTNYIDWAPTPFYLVMPTAYYGNYGEERQIDTILATTLLKYNDEEIDLSSYPNIMNWVFEWTAENHEPGQLTFSFKDSNIEVDGIKGENVCEVSYNQNNDDQEPPTVQRIMTRDNDGNATIYFTDPATGTLSITGGDFKLNSLPVDCGEREAMFSYYTYQPATLKVEYTPNGTMDFEEITMTEDTKKFFMPGFGAYWETSLSNITKKSPNGWYDLRITLTDEAGNYQIQTIPTAFNISGMVGVNQIETIPTLSRYYSIDGLQVDTLIPGRIYIEKTSNGKTRKIIAQ